MARISGLIFSADPIKETLAAAEHLLEFTDEVVIIYAKSHNDYKKIKADNGDKRIRIFYAIKLGYPEPFRTYGIKLCRYSKIAMLDVDERFSNTGKAKELLDSGTADTYSLYRMEWSGEGNKAAYTKQYRLFSKHSIEWRGYLHETPRITGRKISIAKETLHIIHGEGNKGRWRYYELDRVFPVDKPMRIAIREAYVGYSSGKIHAFGILAFLMQKYLQSRKEYEGLPEKNKLIIKKLRKQGVIRYLGLDNPKKVRMLAEKYKNKEQGIDLLIKMLNERYEMDKG